ncbi:hypothetical protein AMJ80_01290 [bacterium SM23_31]|nr:MAG: hypothetical protein AMJ80_01290 [bacterium SM23_31]
MQDRQLTKQPQLAPESTVGGLIFNEKGEIFLMKSDKWRGMYCVPGGHVKLGETLIDAVKREIKEETNLDVNNIEFHSIQDCIFSEYYYKKRHFIFIDFVCNAVSNDVILNDEGFEYVWVSPENIDKYPVEPYTLQMIQFYLMKSNKSRYIIGTSE